jgi:hypothetical protein
MAPPLLLPGEPMLLLEIPGDVADRRNFLKMEWDLNQKMLTKEEKQFWGTTTTANSDPTRNIAHLCFLSVILC